MPTTRRSITGGNRSLTVGRDGVAPADPPVRTALGGCGPPPDPSWWGQRRQLGGDQGEPVTVSTANRAPRPSGLADVLDVVLDKGIVIDAYVRVALLGIEVLTVDARVVIASVDTYLRFAEAVNRLDLYPDSQPKGLPGLLNDGLEQGARVVVKRKLRRPAEKVEDFVESLTGRGDGERR